MMILEQSEATPARRRVAFYCVDATDRVTPETGLSFTSDELKVSQNGGTETSFAGDASTNEIGGGLYWYEFAQAELATIGVLTLRVNKTGVHAEPVICQVISNDLSGNLKADAVTISGSTAAAVCFEDIYEMCPSGTVETANVTPTNTGSCTFNATGITEQTADHYNGRTVLFTSGAMAGSAVKVTDYAWDSGNSEGSFTTTVCQELPVDGTTFRVI